MIHCNWIKACISSESLGLLIAYFKSCNDYLKVIYCALSKVFGEEPIFFKGAKVNFQCF